MVRKTILLLASTVVLMADDMTLDTTKSEVFYEAKKDQFFSTYTVLGINKMLTGSLQRLPNGYRGELTVHARAFVTDSTRRDSSVKEYLHTDTYRLMTYRYELHNGKASGTMRINGVRKELTFPVHMSEVGNQLSVEGNITVKYSDFNIETPSNLVLSAHDDLVIGAKLYFDK